LQYRQAAITFCQAGGYLPDFRASLLSTRTIILGEQKHKCVNDLPIGSLRDRGTAEDRTGDL